MKKVTKMLSVLAASALLLGFGFALAGCSNGDDGGSDTQSSGQETQKNPETNENQGTQGNQGSQGGDTSYTGDIQIVMCGDSIMRTYSPAEGDECGWGQVLQCYFNTTVEVNNTLSNGGRSSKSFYYEQGRWENVKKILEERKAEGKKTYVFINFGHNDQKAKKNYSDYMDYATFAKTNPDGWATTTYTASSGAKVISSYDPTTAPDNGTYQDFLQKYITETKELGGIPVIFSPFVRCESSNKKITDKGAHVLSTAYDGESLPRGDYPAAAKEIAEKNGVAFVDITQLSRDYVDSALAAGKEKFVYWPNDNTHARTLGALKICELAMKELKTKIPELAGRMITPNPRILVDANTIDFGRMYPGNSSTKSFKVSAFNATSGKITITAPDGYTVSKAESTGFAKTIEIDTTGDYFGDDIYIKFEPTEVAEYNAALQVTHTSITPDFGTSPAGTISGNALLIALTGAGKAKAAGGQDYSVTWPMVANGKFSYTATVDPEGVVTAGTATLGSGLKESTVKADYVNKKTRARFCSSTDDWLGTKDDNTYIQFAIPAGNNDVIVNQITLELASSGTGNMRWDVQYSLNDDFSSPVTIIQGGQGTAIDQDGATAPKANDVLTEVKSEADMGMNIKGKTLYVRIYPYMKTADPGKGANRQIMVADVKVEGLVQ